MTAAPGDGSPVRVDRQAARHHARLTVAAARDLLALPPLAVRALTQQHVDRAVRELLRNALRDVAHDRATVASALAALSASPVSTLPDGDDLADVDVDDDAVTEPCS